jgi:signal transduction histidine kinase
VIGRQSIRTRLVVLALIATAPLLVLVAFNASQDLAAARQDAQQEALRIAQLHADFVDQYVQGVDGVLRTLSGDLSLNPQDVEANDSRLRQAAAALPAAYGTFALNAPNGENLGTSISPMTDRARLNTVNQAFLSEALVGGRADQAQRVVARIDATGGLILARPIPGADGRVGGVVHVTARLDRLPRLDARDLPAGSVIMVLDEHGIVLARSPEYAAWVGRDLSYLAWVRSAGQRQVGAGELDAGDGVGHLAAYTPAASVPWLVFVGMPTEIVLGAGRVALLRNVWVGALALGVAVLLAWLLAGRITAPLRQLALDAAALGAGDLSRRTPAETADEVGLLARVFNRMAESVEQHVSREQAARQQMQDLVRRLQVAQEEERRRVASEIHDGLAQVAAGAHQRLQAFADFYAPEAPAARQSLARTVELVQRTVREARRVIAGLRPTVLDDFGLATALRLEVDAFRAEGWDISYDTGLAEKRLPPAIETALFRVAQEALTNIRKHAGKTRVAVTLTLDGPRVRLEVRDWGRGLATGRPEEPPRPGEHVGLLGMRERIALLGGEWAIDSPPGGGARVVAEVPLAEQSAERLNGRTRAA